MLLNRVAPLTDLLKLAWRVEALPGAFRIWKTADGGTICSVVVSAVIRLSWVSIDFGG